jgi:excisionase family DNA binding protein
MLTVIQVSEMLNVKASTIYSWVAQGKIPHVKIHGLIRFHPHEVGRWIHSFTRNQSTKLPILTNNHGDDDSLDRLIAQAKKEAYNPSPRGNRTKIEPQTEGENYGTL